MGYADWDPSKAWDLYCINHPCRVCVDFDTCKECPYREQEEQKEEED